MRITSNFEFIQDRMDGQNQLYRKTESANSSYERWFKYHTEDQILMGFAMDKIAMTSDCFILYAIDFCGCASVEMIIKVLEALKRRCESLSIPTGKAINANVRSRLRVLYDRGLVFRHIYKDADLENDVNLYTVTETAHHILRQRLRRDGFLYNASFSYKTFEDICNWTAASYVGTCMMESEKYVRDLDRVLRTKFGQTFYPAEIKTKGRSGESYYIAVSDGNMLRDNSIQSEEDYKDWLRNKTDEVYRYLTWRTKKGVSMVCLVVKDFESLINTCEILNQCEGLREYLGRIVFTSESVMRLCNRDGEMDKAFCYMSTEGDSYVLAAVENPLFI